MLGSDTQKWIEERCGGRIVDVEQQGRWRPHHFVTLEDGEGRRRILARSPRDPELIGDSRFASHFDLAHEARVLEALQGHGLKIPIFLGFSAEHQLILMEAITGTNDLSEAADDATRTDIVKEYYEQLARLHAIDVGTLESAGFEIPRSAEDIALKGKYQFMEDDFRAVQSKLRPEPLLELGIWWLHANVPSGDGRPRFIQGDTGPGQFMFADGRLTALIDWELAHIGDPMLDLGVARMRNLLYPVGSLHEPMAHYERVSGRPIDREALHYYTVVSMMISPLGMAETIQQPTPKVGSMIARFGWDVTLRRGLCDALAEALELEFEPPELPPVPDADPESLGPYLVEQLEHSCMPLARDDAERFQLDSAVAIARAADLASRVGAQLREDDLDDIGEVLGRRPADRTDGMSRLHKLALDEPEANLAKLVALFARIERRREFLYRPLMIMQASGELEPLAPASLRS
jgi:aminoglycoside phosphotransferase (APT) family kinase protein